MIKPLFNSVFVLLFALTSNVKAQQESLIVYPPAFDVRNDYPVVFIFPGAGGTSLEFAQYFTRTADATPQGLNGAFSRLLRAAYPESFAQRGFVMVLPPGKGNLAVAFEKILKDAEKRIADDLNRLREKRSLKISKVIVSGFSLGGDVSFALLLRNPKDLSGAVVMSSRCGYKGNLAALAGKRLYLTMGDRDPRKPAMQEVKLALDKHNIENKMIMIPNLDHAAPPVEQFLLGMAFVSGG